MLGPATFTLIGPSGLRLRFESSIGYARNMSQVVNLRGLGTDPSNPSAGVLVGTATLPDANPLDGPPPLLNLPFSPGGPSAGRLFRFVRDGFAFGGSVNPEYVEVHPVAVNFDPPGPSWADP
jgi:hypothetical protein